MKINHVRIGFALFFNLNIKLHKFVQFAPKQATQAQPEPESTIPMEPNH